MAGTIKKNQSFLTLGVLGVVLYSWAYFQGLQSYQNYSLIPLFLVVISLLFLHYFLSLGLLTKLPSSFSNQRLVYVFIFAFIFRLIVFFMPPLLSDDIYYYIWHGRVSAQGLNPYLFNPASPELAFLRDAKIWDPLPFKDLPPAYPPFVMASFWLSYLLGGNSLLGFKILLWLPEILICIYGMKLLQMQKKDPSWILIYAWCPLPILEYIGMGHSDIWGIAFLCAFLFYFLREKIFLAFVFLALASLVKWIPLLFIPLLWRYMDWKKRGIAFLAGLLTFILLYLPFLSAGKNVFGLLPTYLKSWEFNGSVYRLLRLCFERADVTHGVVSLIILLFALGIALRKPPLMKGLLAITFFFFLFFHTVYPWYLGWLIPFLFFQSFWSAYAWLYTCFLSYFILLSYRTQGVWQENPWILAFEYLPVLLLLPLQWLMKNKQNFLKKI